MISCATHPGICALEHDGFVSYEEIDEGDWKHPYLVIELKHEIFCLLVDTAENLTKKLYACY